MQGLQINERKIILDSSQRPQTFYQKKDAYARQFSAKWTEYYEASGTSSLSGEKIRLEIQFHQQNKIVNGLIQSDIHLQVAANEGIRKTNDSRSQDMKGTEAFFPFPRTRQWHNIYVYSWKVLGPTGLQMRKTIKRLSKQPERWSRWCTLDQ